MFSVLSLPLPLLVDLKQRKERKEAKKKNLTVSMDDTILETPIDYGYEDHRPDGDHEPNETIGYDPGPSHSAGWNQYGGIASGYNANTSNLQPYVGVNKSIAYGSATKNHTLHDPYASFNGKSYDAQEYETELHDDELLQRTPVTVGSSMNNSMPSLLSVRGSEITDDSRTAAMKWTSFGDLNYDGQQDDLSPPLCETEDQALEGPKPTNKGRKVIRKVKKKKKKKKKKVGNIETTKRGSEEDKITAEQEPEDFAGFFPGSTEEDSKKKKPQKPRGLVMAITRTFSKDGISTPKADKQQRYKEAASPFKVIRSKIPSITLFGKNRRGSPTSVVDTGRQEAHFFDDFVEQDDEEWGGLLG